MTKNSTKKQTERNVPEEEDLEGSKQDIEIEYGEETKLIRQDNQTTLMPSKPQYRARREQKAETLKRLENEK